MITGIFVFLAIVLAFFIGVFTGRESMLDHAVMRDTVTIYGKKWNLYAYLIDEALK